MEELIYVFENGAELKMVDTSSENDDNANIRVIQKDGELSTDILIEDVEELYDAAGIIDSSAIISCDVVIADIEYYYYIFDPKDGELITVYRYDDIRHGMGKVYLDRYVTQKIKEKYNPELPKFDHLSDDNLIDVFGEDCKIYRFGKAKGAVVTTDTFDDDYQLTYIINEDGIRWVYENFTLNPKQIKHYDLPIWDNVAILLADDEGGGFGDSELKVHYLDMDTGELIDELCSSWLDFDGEYAKFLTKIDDYRGKSNMIYQILETLMKNNEGVRKIVRGDDNNEIKLVIEGAVSDVLPELGEYDTIDVINGAMYNDSFEGTIVDSTGKRLATDCDRIIKIANGKYICGENTYGVIRPNYTIIDINNNEYVDTHIDNASFVDRLYDGGPIVCINENDMVLLNNELELIEAYVGSDQFVTFFTDKEVNKDAFVFGQVIKDSESKTYKLVIHKHDMVIDIPMRELDSDYNEFGVEGNKVRITSDGDYVISRHRDHEYYGFTTPFSKDAIAYNKVLDKCIACIRKDY